MHDVFGLRQLAHDRLLQLCTASPLRVTHFYYPICLVCGLRGMGQRKELPLTHTAGVCVTAAWSRQEVRVGGSHLDGYGALAGDMITVRSRRAFDRVSALTHSAWWGSAPADPGRVRVPDGHPGGAVCCRLAPLFRLGESRRSASASVAAGVPS